LSEKFAQIDESILSMLHLIQTVLIQNQYHITQLNNNLILVLKLDTNKYSFFTIGLLILSD
ncbi:hypothetical protein ACJX0J_016035, partial [Zea mays]